MDRGDYQLGSICRRGLSKALQQALDSQVRRELFPSAAPAENPVMPSVHYSFDPAVQGGLRTGLTGLFSSLFSAVSPNCVWSLFSAICRRKSSIMCRTNWGRCLLRRWHNIRWSCRCVWMTMMDCRWHRWRVVRPLPCRRQFSTMFRPGRFLVCFSSFCRCRRDVAGACPGCLCSIATCAGFCLVVVDRRVGAYLIISLIQFALIALGWADGVASLGH